MQSIHGVVGIILGLSIALLAFVGVMWDWPMEDIRVVITIALAFFPPSLLIIALGDI